MRSLHVVVGDDKVADWSEGTHGVKGIRQEVLILICAKEYKDLFENNHNKIQGND